MLLSLMLVTVTEATVLQDRHMQIISTLSTHRKAQALLPTASKLIQRFMRLHFSRKNSLPNRLPLLSLFHIQLTRFRIQHAKLLNIDDQQYHIRQELHRHEDIATAIVNVISRELNLPKDYTVHENLGRHVMMSKEVIGKIRKNAVKQVNMMYAMKYVKDKKVAALGHFARDSAIERLRVKSRLQGGSKKFE